GGPYRLLEQDVDNSDVQEILGHSTATVTRKYTPTSPKNSMTAPPTPSAAFRGRTEASHSPRLADLANAGSRSKAGQASAQSGSRTRNARRPRGLSSLCLPVPPSGLKAHPGLSADRD